MSSPDEDKVCGCYTTASGRLRAYSCYTHSRALTLLFSVLFVHQKVRKKETPSTQLKPITRLRSRLVFHRTETVLKDKK